MCAERDGSDAGAESGVSDEVVACASQRAPAVEQISDHGPLPVAGIISRDSVGTNAKPSAAIKAMRSSQESRCLKKFTVGV